MPTIRLVTGQWANPLDVDLPAGGSLSIPQPQFRCLLRLPNQVLPKDAIIDTGAPLTCIPQDIWDSLRVGVDYEWLPFAAGMQPPSARIAGWQFTFRIARFLVPVSLLDYSTEVERPDVICQFADGNPPSYAGRKSLPPIIIGLWGGLLEGGKIGVERDPSSGRVNGELAFP
ncbi:MAG: hypothetical protein L0241_31745 [Planctomycetia bacterium]|nr:hypothetical protein [Planctomycetia bacterium]